MKKLASVVLASAMAVVPFAAGLAATFTPGEYEASAQGFGGTVTVKVTVDEEKVTAVTVTGEGETPTLGGAAIEGYNTSLVGVSDADAVDATAGATVTSTAVKDALAKADCALKISTCVNTAFQCAFMALDNVCVQPSDGIVDKDPEQTIKNFVRLGNEGSPVMDDIVLDVMLTKQK